eukprot:scaffold97493_cov21-Tisochrysis_lutea.AAC.1
MNLYFTPCCAKPTPMKPSHAHEHRYIMTSQKALGPTKAFLADNAFFGLHASQVCGLMMCARDICLAAFFGQHISR